MTAATQQDPQLQRRLQQDSIELAGRVIYLNPFLYWRRFDANTDRWLRELDVVQAFNSAQPQHGGTGAVYVLLRKSEEKKRENRERFSKGRVPYDA